jgi:hypothetical protein
MTLELKFEKQTPPAVRSHFRKAWCVSGINIHMLDYAGTVR